MVRVAICGTFDIENYGDLLFPVIFKSALAKRGVVLDLLLFSPFGSDPIANSMVGLSYSLSKLEEVHRCDPIDAIFVGGGALVHFNNIFQKLPGAAPDGALSRYPIYQTWILPSIVSSLFGVPVLWNAPDAPYRFPDALRPVVKLLVSSVDYVSVRNQTSKENLVSIGISEDLVRIVPDTALCIKEYLQLDGLSSSPALPDRYIVVQLNSYIDRTDLSDLGEILEKHAAACGEHIVLLPLAATHLDEAALYRLLDGLNVPALLVTPRSIEEAVSIIAGARTFVGVSFHGAITAIAFDVPAIAFNYMKYKKTQELYESLDYSCFYAESAADLATCFDRLRCGVDLTGHRDKLYGAKLEIERHFDFFATFLRKKSLGSSFSQAQTKPFGRALFGLTEAIIGTHASAAGFAASLAHALEKVRWLEEEVYSLRQMNSDLIIHIQNFEKSHEARTARLIDRASLVNIDLQIEHILQKLSWLEGQWSQEFYVSNPSIAGGEVEVVGLVQLVSTLQYNVDRLNHGLEHSLSKIRWLEERLRGETHEDGPGPSEQL